MRNFKRYFISALALAVVIAVGGCAPYPVNGPLNDCRPGIGYTLENLDGGDAADELFVVLTFSGGGTRAAALAYGVLEELRGIEVPGKGKNLLSEVDVISTVSGGSFTGAYYALFGDEIFKDFQKDFLDRNIEMELAGKLFNPVNWFRLASPTFSRIDMAAELYHETIFREKTFKTLAEAHRRPFLIMNATNLYQGARFEFTSDQFRYLGSDLLTYPVARGVAASSAFPFLLSPLSLKNYACQTGRKRTLADDKALDDYWLNKRRYYSAFDNTLYEDMDNHGNLHLMDGGLADNLGLRAIEDLYVRAGIRKKINDGKIKRFLVIVVNAKSGAQKNIDKSPSPPGLITVGYKTCTIPMDNYTAETVAVFKDMTDQRAQDQKVLDVCQENIDQSAAAVKERVLARLGKIKPKEAWRDLLGDALFQGRQLPSLAGAGMKLFVAELEFNNLPDAKDREYFNSLPTSFALKKEQVKALIQVGGELLREHPVLSAFLNSWDQ